MNSETMTFWHGKIVFNVFIGTGAVAIGTGAVAIGTGAVAIGTGAAAIGTGEVSRCDLTHIQRGESSIHRL
jgi:autotransporter adhesin